MAVNTTGITPTTNWAPVVWATEYSDATQAATVLAGLTDRSFEPQLKFGKTIDIPDRSNPAVRIKAEDTTATWANIAETQQTITVNRQAYVAFLVEDIAEIQSKYEVRSTYTTAASYSLAAFVDGDGTSGLTSLPSGFTNLVGTLGTDPSDDDLIAGKNFLDGADVPLSDRFIYASPGYVNGMLKLGTLRNADFVGSDADQITKTGNYVGRTVYGCPVYQSTLATNNPAVAGQAYGWMCHRRGVAVIMQRTPTVHTQEVILEGGTGVMVDCIYNFAKRLITPKTLGGAASNDAFNVGLRGPS